MVWKRLKINYLTKMLPFLRYFDIIVVSTKLSGADTGGGGTFAPTDRFREGCSPPPEFGIFCSYFQNSFSIACLRERNPSAKQEKYLS